ncbi:unnamed protein product [Rangifer tarandus platyrhynchus]|uniref:Uncharacterized protein n=2 Tax=Rangifer tarandus platyrhynchus TaxID=3082113 RepID=A0ACB0EN46_RANTA|nr:unnamed protein product [Rangifer tarandus platyrhynchus]CAI9701654.1 unnamed protein product [Rangifer tarandus platyrhynchus]
MLKEVTCGGDTEVRVRHLVFPILQRGAECSKALGEATAPRCENPGSLSYHVEESHQLIRTIHTGLIYMQEISLLYATSLNPSGFTGCNSESDPN